VIFRRKKIVKKLQVPAQTRPLPEVSVPFPWQRVTLSLCGLFFIFFMWSWSTNHLYALPKDSLASFTSITNNSLYTVAALVIWFVTGKLVTDLKTTAVRTVIEEAKDVVVDRAKTEKKPPAPKHFDDGKI